jgi:hypothetical protein
MPALPGAPIRMRHSLSWCGSRKQASPTKGGKSIGGECWANDPNILLADSRARCHRAATPKLLLAAYCA